MFRLRVQFYGNTKVSKIHFLFVCLFVSSLIRAAYLLKYSECIDNEENEAENCVGIVWVLKKKNF